VSTRLRNRQKGCGPFERILGWNTRRNKKCKDLLREYMALLREYRALLREYMALLREYRALLREN